MVFPKTSILIQVPSRSIVKSRENTATSSRLQVMKTASAPQRRKLKGFLYFFEITTINCSNGCFTRSAAMVSAKAATNLKPL